MRLLKRIIVPFKRGIIEVSKTDLYILFRLIVGGSRTFNKRLYIIELDIPIYLYVIN
jgi:hypothetical protein